jgi:hypothetical protein
MATGFFQIKHSYCNANNKDQHVESEILTVVVMKKSVFWDIKITSQPPKNETEQTTWFYFPECRHFQDMIPRIYYYILQGTQ